MEYLNLEDLKSKLLDYKKSHSNVISIDELLELLIGIKDGFNLSEVNSQIQSEIDECISIITFAKENNEWTDYHTRVQSNMVAYSKSLQIIDKNLVQTKCRSSCAYYSKAYNACCNPSSEYHDKGLLAPDDCESFVGKDCSLCAFACKLQGSCLATGCNVTTHNKFLPRCCNSCCWAGTDKDSVICLNKLSENYNNPVWFSDTCAHYE